MKTFVKDCRWGRFILIHGDMISQYVDMYGEWVEAEVDLFCSLLAGGACIEVGANIGLHTVPISRCASSVIVYEPQRPIYHVLCGNLALNDARNVLAKNLGVGDAPDRVTIQTSTYDAAWNYGSFSLTRGFHTEGAFPDPTASAEIEIVTLDDDPDVARLERIDLIKIDAEGFEPRVLAGALKTIARARPYLFIEGNEASIITACRTALEPLGYQAFWYLAMRHRPDNFNRSAFNTMAFDRNLVFVPPERPGLVGQTAPLMDLRAEPPPYPPGTPIYSRYPQPPGEAFAFVAN